MLDLTFQEDLIARQGSVDYKAEFSTREIGNVHQTTIVIDNSTKMCVRVVRNRWNFLKKSGHETNT